MRYTPHHQRNTDKPKRDWHDNATLLIAIVGVFVVAVSTGITAWMAVLMRDEIAALRDQQRIIEAQQRPWLNVNAIEIGNNYDGLTFTDTQAYISFRAMVTNIGQAVAINAFVQARLVSGETRTDYLVEDTAAILESQTQMCEIMKGSQRTDNNIIGISIFPGESAELFSYAAIPIEGLNDRREIIAGDDRLSLLLVGCVDYQFYVSDRHMQTQFAYRVLDRDGSRIWINVEENIPPERVAFEKHYIGNNYAD